MTCEELEEKLFRWGAELRGWPADQAAAAQTLIDADPEAAQLLADFAAREGYIAEAVPLPSFGAPEIGNVLSRLDAEEENWGPGRRFWIASAIASAVAFSSGAVATLVLLPSMGGLDVLLPIIGIAAGQGNVGGLM